MQAGAVALPLKEQHLAFLCCRKAALSSPAGALCSCHSLPLPAASRLDHAVPRGLCSSCPIPGALSLPEQNRAALQVWSRVDQPPHSSSATLHLALQPATARGVLCLKCLFQAIKQV